MPLPETPRKGNDGVLRVVLNLNAKFNLDLPIETSPRTPSNRINREQRLVSDCLGLLKWAYWNASVDLDKVIVNFEEWALPASNWVHKPNQAPGTLPSRSPQNPDSFLHRSKTSITASRREEMLRYLLELLENERYLVRNGLVASPKSASSSRSNGVSTPATETSPKLDISTASSGNRDVRLKRRNDGVHEVFATAPNSPSSSPHESAAPSVDDDFDADDSSLLDSTDDQNVQSPTPKKQRQSNLGEFFPITKQADQDITKPLFPETNKIALTTSFSTVTTTTKSTSFESETVATSFSSDIGKEASSTDPFSQYSDVFGDEDAPCVSEIQAPVSDAAAPNPSDEKLRVIIGELEKSGPFSQDLNCMSTLPLRYRYEVERVALARKVPAEKIAPDAVPQDYNEFWKALQKDSACFVEKSKPGPWKMAVDKFNGPDDTVVTLSGQLNWASPSEKGIFSLALNAMKFERSHRLCRRFGSDRFLEITFPALSRFPDHLKSRTEYTVLHKAISIWFAASEHHLLGRVWRAFFLEDVKQKKNAKKQEMKCRLFLFAIDGLDFCSRFQPPLDPLYVSPQSEDSGSRTPMSIRGFFNWHIPLGENDRQKQCKLFQRMSLGLSRTLPTVIIKPEEFVFVPDPKGTVMNDGCALMSMSLGCEIAERLGLENVPSCFQGRIAGAKGIWMIHRNDDKYIRGNRKFWIEIAESQLKILPPPGPDQTAHFDDGQLTFEVVSWSRPLRPVELNPQLLTVLQQGGVNEAHITDLVRREIQAEYDELQEVISQRNTILCLNQAQSMRSPDDHSNGKTRDLDGFPSEDIEQAILLLESGFLPLELPVLTDIFKSLLDRRFKALEKLKIRVPLSTYAYCIADPYGVLEPDEVHFAFSQPWKERGYRDDLDGVDVLVARLPAHLPSDVQKRRAVFKTELRHFKDVIVFSTKGDIPLASELSGGDYDGDAPWICWDPSFVDHFTNTPFKPDSLPSAKELGLADHSHSMRKFSSFDSFLADVFTFNALPSKLGLCTIAYERHCYYSDQITSDASKKFAALLGYLVDCRKAGLELTEERWKEFQDENRISKGEEPLYKRESTENVKTWNKKSILDHLRFGVVKGEKFRYKEGFKRFCNENSTNRADSHLIEIWGTLMDRARKEQDKGKGRLLFNALEDIIRAIDNAHKQWLSFIPEKPRATIVASAANFLEQVEAPVFDHELSTVWRNSPDEWAKVRASRAYYAFHEKAKFPWYATGKILCELKAKALGPTRTMTAGAHHACRIDRRVVRRTREQLNRGEGEDEYAEDLDEDEFGEDIFADVDPLIYETFDDGYESDIDWVSLA